jgi:hypothetical protein
MPDRTSPLPPRPSERGQTSQDYALGISIFLLTLTFVIGYFPTLLAPYDTGAGAAESATGNRVSEAIISEVESGRAPNDLNATKTAVFFERNLSRTNFRENLSVRTDTSVNISVRTLGRSAVVEVFDPSGTPTTLLGGTQYNNESSVTVSRVVTMRNAPATCQPACRILVRVW